MQRDRDLSTRGSLRRSGMTVGSLPRTSPRLEELVMPHVTPLVLRHMGSSLKFPNNLQGPSSTDGDAWSPQRAGDTERLRHRRSGPVRLSLTSTRRVSRRASAPYQGCAASDQASVPRSRPHLTSPFPMTHPPVCELGPSRPTGLPPHRAPLSHLRPHLMSGRGAPSSFLLHPCTWVLKG